MNDQTDQQLLCDFAEHRSEAAFTELVGRYIDLVHSTAFRLTREAHSAQDVTQAVFVVLAQSAARLTQHPVLSGWLHTTARNLAAKNVRATVRRQTHEQEAATMNELLATAPDASWDEIAPHLDAALGELSESDRDAVMLRYFEKKSAAEIAARLGTSAEAAQKRVSRSLERLREIFANRGVSVGAGGLAVVISANAVQAAPSGLVATISTTALAGTAVTASTIVAATTKTIAMTTLQKTLVTATVAVLTGAGIYEARQAAQLRDQVQTLQQQQAPLAEQIQRLQNNFAEATNRLADLLAETLRMKSNPNQAELLRLRGEVGVLRQQVSKTKNASHTNSDLAGELPKDKLQYAGYATPENALQTWAWAQVNRNYDVFRESIAPEGKDELTPQQFERMPAEGFESFRIMAEKTFGEDKIEVKVRFTSVSGTQILIIPCTRIGADWKLGPGDIHSYSSNWESDGLIQTLAR